MSNTILWRRPDNLGHEIGRLVKRADGWELSGTAVFSHEQQPCQLDYLVACDSDWCTNSAHIGGTIGVREVDLTVCVEPGRRWRLNGAECPAVAGCVDIDLGFSPSTNLLPIRRLSLAIGAQANVTAAWLPFPSLVFEPLLQLYRRDSATGYRYESSGGRVARVLTVNAVGFVTEYPGLWQMESAT